jgi:hypothetical protein
MVILTPVQPVVYESNTVALEICGIAVPIEKAELKLHCKKTEITSTSSYSYGFLWDEFAPGNIGGSLNWDSHWRISQAVTPPMVLPGFIFPIRAFIRRPLTNGVTDRGAFFAFRLIIDDSTITLDPKNGGITWRCSGTITGPVGIFV